MIIKKEAKRTKQRIEDGETYLTKFDFSLGYIVERIKS